MNAPPLHLALLRGPSDFVPLCERILKSELTTALDIASWGSRYLPLHTAIVAGAPAAVLERLVRAYDAATQWEHEDTIVVGRQRASDLHASQHGHSRLVASTPSNWLSSRSLR